MPAIVTLTKDANTMDQWRQTIIRVTGNVNAMLEGQFVTSANISTTQSNSGYIAINVNSGFIQANGMLLTGITNTSVIVSPLGFTNAQLNSNSFVIATGPGLAGGNSAAVVNLGQTLLITASPVDSLVNTRTDLAASANAIVAAISLVGSINVANATLITTGVVQENFGGTGETAFTNGTTLIANTIGFSHITQASIFANSGILLTPGAGALTLTMNIVQGSNVNVAVSGNGGITISMNAIANATTSSPGILSFADDYNTIDPTIGVTPNAVNALYSNIVSTPATPSSSNSFGRLLFSNIYIGTTTPQTWYWVKPANLAFVIVTVIGPGGGGGATNSSSGTSNTADLYFGLPGQAGAFQKGIILSANLFSNTTIHIGATAKGGSPDNSVAFRTGTSATNSRFGNTSSASTGQWLLSIGGRGGRSDVSTVSSNSTANAFTMLTNYTTTTSNTFMGGSTSENTKDTGPTAGIRLLSFVQERHGGIGYTIQRGMANTTAFMEDGGRTPGSPGAPGGSLRLANVANGNTVYSDAFGFGHGGSGSLCVGTQFKGSRGGNGAPGIIIIEAYSNV